MSAEIKSISDAVEKLGLAWEEFKRTNEERVAQAIKGTVDPLITEKLTRLNGELDKASAFKTAYEAEQKATSELLADMQAKINRALSAGGDPKGAGLTPEQQAYKTALLDSYLRKGQKRDVAELELKAMSVSSDPDGGYTVTPDMSGRIVARVFELSPMRQHATVETIGSDALEGLSSLDEADAGWVGEVSTRSETTSPSLGNYRIPVHEMHASPRATQKLLDDSSWNIEEFLQRKSSQKFGRLESAAFVVGTGVAKPRGFASYTTAATADASRAWGVFEHVATGTSGGFGTDPNGITKLITLQHKLKEAHRLNAKWFMNRSTLGSVRGLTDASSAGKFVFLPSFIVGQPDTLLGDPVAVFQDMVDVAADSLSIAYGDMRETYTIVDRLGIRVLRDPFTAKPHVVFYTTKRVGGDALNFDAMKFLKFGTS